MKYAVIDTEKKIFPTYFRTKTEALAYVEEMNNNLSAIAKGDRLQVVRKEIKKGLTISQPHAIINT